MSLIKYYVSQEIILISNLQAILPNWLAIFFSKFSTFVAPHTMFWCVFPFLHFFFKNNNCWKLPLAIIISDTANLTLKWLFFGNRPYWYENSLQQFPGTCETGPGNPSGHMMVSMAAYPILAANIRQGCLSQKYKSVIVKLLQFSMLCVAISRVYLAAHFPHQVILGSIFGYLIGSYILKGLSEDKIITNEVKNGLSRQISNFQKWIKLSVIILVIPLIIYNICVKLLKINLDWTLEMATNGCKNQDWVHKATNPMTTLFKMFGATVGMSLYCNNVQKINQKYIYKILKFLLLSSIIYQSGYWFRNHGDSFSSAQFYVVGFMHYGFVPLSLSFL